MAEQLICNQQVDGSTPFTSSIFLGDFPSGQRGQTVNLLSLTSVVRIHHPPPKQPTGICLWAVLIRNAPDSDHLRRKPYCFAQNGFGSKRSFGAKQGPETTIPHQNSPQAFACGLFCREMRPIRTTFGAWSPSSVSNHFHIYVVFRHSSVVRGRFYCILFAHTESYVVFNMLLNAQ